MDAVDKKLVQFQKETLVDLYREWVEIYKDGIPESESRSRNMTDGNLLNTIRQRIMALKLDLLSGKVFMMGMPPEFYYPNPPHLDYTYMARSRKVQGIQRDKTDQIYDNFRTKEEQKDYAEYLNFE